MILIHNFISFFLLIKKNPRRFFIKSFLLFFFVFLVLFSSTNSIYDKQSENFQDNLMTSTPPIFSVNSPINYTLCGKIAPDYSITITDGLGNYSWYEFIGTGENSVPIELNGIPNENVIGTFDQSLWDNLDNGTATIRFFLNNSLGEVGQADAIVRIDIIDPNINVISPIGGYFNSVAPAFIIEIWDPNLEKMWYTLNTNTTKYFFDINETIDQDAWNLLPDGIVNITFFANDSVNNMHSIMTQVTKDTIDPVIIITAPIGGVYDGAPAYDITITEDNLNQYWYTLNGGSPIYITSTTDTIDSTEWGNLIDGPVEIIFYADDDVGHVGSNSVTVTKDTTDPVIVITAPVVGVYDDAPDYNITITEDNLNQYWYTLNGGSPIYITSTTGTIDSTEWEALSDGPVEIMFYADDAAGHVGSNSVTVTKDTTDPVIVITTPVVGVYDGAPAYNIIITEDNLNQYWYTLNDGSPIYITSTTGTIDSTEWGNLLDGPVEIMFYADDAAGHVGSNSVTVTKDTTDPVIAITAPIAGVYDGAPAYNITITEDNLNQYWYTLNGGSPIYITSTTGTIDSTEWEALSDGPVEIMFYADDAAGHVGSNSVTVIKDATDPVIIINSPAEDSVWDEAPDIFVSVTDLNFNSTWYSVNSTNGWSNNITLTNNQAQELDVIIWNNLPAEGTFQLYVFANDTAGNLNMNFITIFKDILFPRVKINFPNNHTYWDAPPAINISAYDFNLESIWYQVETTAPIRINNNEEVLLDIGRWDNLIQGEFTVSFYVYDILDHVNDTFVLTLFKDTEPPIININSPNNLSYWITPPTINIIIYEQQLNASWYRVNSSLGWSEKIDLLNSTDQLLDLDVWSSLDQGEFQIYFYANDSFGYLNDFYNLTLYKDDIVPELTINLPLPGNDQWNVEPILNVAYFDINYDTLLYRVYSLSTGWSYDINLANNTDQLLETIIWNSLDQGEFQIYIYANDTFGNFNDAYIILYKDTLPPVIINNSPMDNSFWNKPPPINITVYDPNFVGDIWYMVDEYPTTPEILVNNTQQDLDTNIWDNLEQGLFHLRVWCSDSFDETSVIVIPLYKNTISPIIIINSPNNQTYWNTPPTINVIICEQQLNASWYRVYSSFLGWSGIIDLANNTDQLLDPVIWNSLIQEEFQIHIYANDSFGNLNYPIHLTLYKDTIAPMITVNLPNNGSIWNEAPNIHVTTLDPTIDSVWYRIYSSSTGWSNNITLTLDLEQAIESNIWDNLPSEGTFQVYVYGSDIAGNINNPTILTLLKDQIAPRITINDPNLYDLFGNDTFNFDLSIIDPNLNTTWYSLYTDATGWSININLNTGETSGIIDYSLWEVCPNGTVTIRFYSNDTVGNIEFQEVMIYKDMIPPEIDIILPIPYDRIGYFPPDFNINIEEPHLNIKWYILINATNPLDRSEEYLIIADSGTISQLAWMIFENGLVIIRIYANDTLGNTRFAEVIVEKDTHAPDIMIEEPSSSNNIFGMNAPNFILFISGENIDSTWYILQNSTYTTGSYIFTGVSGTIDQTAWDNFEPQSIIIYFYINDTSGNINSDWIIVEKDLTAPIVIINYPNNHTYCNKQPILNIDTPDMNISTIWYKVNSSTGWSDIIILSINLDQFLDLAIWDSLEQGEFQINIYANDTQGNINDGYVLIMYKDTITPNITIIMPNESDKVKSESPIFEVSILELNIDVCWYSIEGTHLNITFTGLIGRIDQVLWENLWNNISDGEKIKIKFYASDKAGNIGFNELEVIKQTSEPFDLMEILGGPMGLILAGTSAGVMLPVTLSIRKTRYYRSLEKKDKKKISRILLLVYVCLFLLIVTIVL